jgi:hypothetical protein
MGTGVVHESTRLKTIDNVIRFLQFQKDRVGKGEITPSTLRNYVKSLKLLCDVFTTQQLNKLFVTYLFTLLGDTFLNSFLALKIL